MEYRDIKIDTETFDALRPEEKYLEFLYNLKYSYKETFD
jgi:hypothetical protein